MIFSMQPMVKIILDSLFPRRCIVCDRPLAMHREILCRECDAFLYPIGPLYCMKCGKQLEGEGEVLCRDCSVKQHAYNRGRGCCLYEGAMKKSMYRFKYGGRREYAAGYAALLGKTLGDWLQNLGAQALVPIPIHEKRRRERGYNQAELLARALSKQLQIPVRNDLLKRVQETEKQKELDVRLRENNLKKAFKTTRNDVKLDTVILIDDIYTTGATMDAAAACLKRAGVSQVYFVTMCIGRNT